MGLFCGGREGEVNRLQVCDLSDGCGGALRVREEGVPVEVGPQKKCAVYGREDERGEEECAGEPLAAEDSAETCVSDEVDEDSLNELKKQAHFVRLEAGNACVSCWGDMASEQKLAAVSAGFGMLLLGIDTCGPTGSVALGRLAGAEGALRAGNGVEILGEIELEGRSYSSTLVTAVGDLLRDAGVGLKDLGAIVAVHGPGSFTGVRLGLSAVKGLAEPLRIPVAVVSRLEVLAAKGGAAAAALDAHRGEVFLRIGGPRELLGSAAELNAVDPTPELVAVCDDEAAALVASAWASAKLIRVAAPTAGDALRQAAARVAEGEFVDLALLDGDYLRRSDAEIFGDAAEAKRG